MRIVPLVLCLMTGLALAQPPDLEPVPDGPPLTAQDGDITPLPEVTIRRRGDQVIEEHRINGRLYMVRVEPRRGFPYYLIDTDGDGSLETRYNDLAEGIIVPSWVILSW